MKMIGVSAVRGRPLMYRAVSKPSMPGIWTSSSTQANVSRRSWSSASVPDPTQTRRCFSGSRVASIVRRFAGRSSTTRMLVCGSSAIATLSLLEDSRLPPEAVVRGESYRRACPRGRPRRAACPRGVRSPTSRAGGSGIGGRCDNRPVAASTASEAVGAAFARRVREEEERRLSPAAARSYPARRVHPEEDCSLRTPFQRDRDRIVHCKAFRRLKHKTQVFVAPEGDHYRTRLTHTLEVAQISRTVARALRLNEDLAEAVGVGHDLGHPPFGHIGEAVLDRCLAERFSILGDSGSERIDTLVHDLVEHSERAGEIVQGPRVGEAMAELRAFMFEEVYLGPVARREHAKIEVVLRALFHHYVADPDALPDGGGAPDADLAQRVTDYLAGMTDRYCIRAFEALAVPSQFAV